MPRLKGADKPSALKELQGEKRPERLNPAEPKPEVAIVDAPSHLSPEEAQYWNYYFPILYNMKVMSLADVKQLEIFCEVCANYDYYKEKLREEGHFVRIKKYSRDGIHMYDVEVVNPVIRLLNAARKEIDKFGGALALNPQDRSRMSINPNAEPEGKGIEKFIRKAK